VPNVRNPGISNSSHSVTLSVSTSSHSIGPPYAFAVDKFPRVKHTGSRRSPVAARNFEVCEPVAGHQKVPEAPSCIRSGWFPLAESGSGGTAGLGAIAEAQNCVARASGLELEMSQCNGDVLDGHLGLIDNVRKWSLGSRVGSLASGIRVSLGGTDVAG
jgi:hypothetical protein